MLSPELMELSTLLINRRIGRKPDMQTFISLVAYDIVKVFKLNVKDAKEFLVLCGERD